MLPSLCSWILLSHHHKYGQVLNPLASQNPPFCDNKCAGKIGAKNTLLFASLMLSLLLDHYLLSPARYHHHHHLISCRRIKWLDKGFLDLGECHFDNLGGWVGEQKIRSIFLWFCSFSQDQLTLKILLFTRSWKILSSRVSGLSVGN